MKSYSPTTLVIIGLVIVGVISFGVYSANKSNDVSKSNSDAKNSTYIVDGQSVTLTNGFSVVEIAPGSASKTLTQYFGNELLVDLNNDGYRDTVFFLTQNKGGSGTFFYVAAALQTPGGYVGSEALYLGDRIAPQSIDESINDTIAVNFSDRKQGESFDVPPSVEKSLQLLLNTQTMQFEKMIQEEPEPSVEITYTNATADLITVELPFPGAVVGKAFTVLGDARGYWFFEASFPIVVVDENDNEIAIGIAQAQGEWMTEDFVPFTSDIVIPESFIGPATLILKKDNPSGMSENDASISFPITIEY